ncbi:SDR family NAD(P)-dependent oxidoreductase, partial [Streptomyces griseus]|uniref:SDR family NAD(P)-dependent oxidoreductase n=1 Tax=Streptomyces griseus TaxID=1911 RepID=UPI003F73DC78
RGVAEVGLPGPVRADQRGDPGVREDVGDLARLVHRTMIGAAPYSVTKHGAVAFAEWLSLTYRHRGIKVHAICPQGVRTDMLTAAGSAGELVLAPGAVEPDAVADALFEAMDADRFLVLPHPEVAGYYQARAADPDRWMGNMNKLQQKWEASEA